MMSKPGKQTIAIYILSNISRFEGTQTMNIINMRNIFLEKSFTKCGGETIP